MKKILQIFGIGLIAISMAACPSRQGRGPAGQPAEQTVFFALGSEPPDLNSMLTTDAVSGQILGHIGEGLITKDWQGKLSGGVAQRWEINETTATFYLRKNALWSDGKPVTARDFVFAWRTVVDPKTASQYAFIMYPIKNAEAITQGKKPVEQLGVEAIDDYTLKVTFEQPCPYFLSLLSMPTYFPVREDFYKAQNGRYAADAKNLLFNGPFKLTSWVHDASMRLEKNEFYWNKDKIKLQMIDIPYMVKDPKARFDLFRDKKIDLVHLDSDTMQSALKEKMNLLRFSEGNVFYMELNHRPNRVTSNKKLRQAIRSVYDVRELVDKILALPGIEPAFSLFPRWLKGVKSSFREEYPVPEPKVDIAGAKKLLEEAKKELKLTEIPELTLLLDDSPNSKKQGEYLQSQLARHLGIKLNLDPQTFKQRLAKMTSGDFDIVFAGWGPDYEDPMTFADLFTSWNENNRGQYKNKEYDKAIKEAMTTMDPKKRMDAMARVQKIILEDVVIIPQYERGLVYVQNPKLKGVIRQVTGPDPNFIYAWLEK